MLKRILSIVTLSLVAVAPLTAEAAFDRKVALVVGNAAYQNAPALANPVTDAKAMAAAFERLGFETVTGYDLDKDALEATIRRFSRAARSADLTAFFYAGHGVAFDNRNFLVPVDAKFTDATALDFEAVSTDFVIKQMRYGNGVSLVFLDACRDNPLAGTLSRSLGQSTRSALSRGLTVMDVKNAGKGLAIAFATSPGEVAYDGAAAHSPFAEALLNNIETEGKDITEVMSRVTGEVLKSTDERQRPWLNASLTGPVVLKPVPTLNLGNPLASGSAAPAASANAPAGMIEVEKSLFQFAQQTGRVSSYRAYLSAFPEGVFAGIARNEIAARSGDEAVSVIEVASLTTPGGKVVTDVVAPTEATLVAAAATEATPVGNVPEGTQEIGSEANEAALGLDRSARREIQVRLNLSGADVGGADGLFGPRTRSGIAGFQETLGAVSSGYLTATQIAALNENTDSAYADYLDERAAARARRAQARAKATATRSVKKTAGKAAPRKTAKKKTVSRKRVATRPAPVRQARAPRVVEYVEPRYTRPRRHNPAAAAFVGGVVGSLIIGSYGR